MSNISFGLESHEDAILDLKEEIRLCGDVQQRSRLQRRLEDLELREAERLAAIGQAEAKHQAAIKLGELRMAAAKARHDRKCGTLKSEVTVTDEAAVDHAMARLTAEAKVSLAFEAIKARSLYPVHSKALLEAYVDELKAAQPELAPFIPAELPQFAPNIQSLDYDLPPYIPPPPAPKPWPAPSEEYLAVASPEFIAAAIREGHVLSHEDPNTWQVQMAGPLNTYGSNPRKASDVSAAVARGAKLAWIPGARRVTPPAVEGARWVEHVAGGSMLLELATSSAEQAA